MRKRSRTTELPPEELLSDLDDQEDRAAERIDQSDYRDDVLRLLFICCHPDLPATQQIAMALRIVSGLSVKQIAQQHWKHFGRHYYARHDYDELPGPAADAVMQALAGQLATLPGQTLGDYTVTLADEFSYQDPVDGSLAVNQGLRVVFGDAARLILRLSGTGTKGATLRLYLERYETAFYRPLVSDWRNFETWQEDGARTATERANDRSAAVTYREIRASNSGGCSPAVKTAWRFFVS